MMIRDSGLLFGPPCIYKEVSHYQVSSLYRIKNSH